MLRVFVTALALAAPRAAARRTKVRQQPVQKEQGPELPTGGAWAYEKTEWLAREQLGRCIRPELPSSDLTWLTDLKAAVGQVPQPLQAWAQSYSRKLQVKIGGYAVGDWLPFHRAVGLTSKRTVEVPAAKDYPVPNCQSFDYTADPAPEDPHGCGLFRNSFSRLQEVKQCIVDSLEEGSDMWRRYRKVAMAIREARTDGSRYTDSPSKITGEDLKAVTDPDFVEDFRACATSGACVILDADRRADEMMKYLSFKDWSEVGKPLKAWAEAKVRYTASVHKVLKQADTFAVIGVGKQADVKRNLGLEDDVVGHIVGTCFGVTADSYEDLPQETIILQRSLACNPLMFDTVEVPGAPQAPLTNAAGMWDQSLALGTTDLPEGSLMRTPPVCSRAAAALAGWPQVHAAGGYSVRFCIASDPRWKQCSQATNFNCICFEKCWRVSLRRVCELDPGCCGDKASLV